MKSPSAMGQRGFLLCFTGSAMKLKLLFPPLRVWLQALGLALAAYSGPVVLSFYFWALLVLLVALLLNGIEAPLVALLVLVALVACGVGLVLVVWLWRGMLHLLWSSPPRWLIPGRGLRVRLHQVVVILLAAVPLVLLAVSRITIGLALEDLGLWVRQFDLVTLLINNFWLYLVSCTYLLYWFPLKEKAQRHRSPVQGTDQPT